MSASLALLLALALHVPDLPPARRTVTPRLVATTLPAALEASAGAEALERLWWLTTESIDPNPAQREALASILRTFGADGAASGGEGGGEAAGEGGEAAAGSRRAFAQLAAGSGKTLLQLLVVAAMARGEHGGPPIQSALIVVPRLLLADQTLQELRRFGELLPELDVLLVASKSSDKTVRRATGLGAADEIESFLSPAGRGPSRFKLVISTLSSLPKVGEALQRPPGRRLGLAVFDEAHWLAGVGRTTGFGLDDAALPAAFRLFLTATPELYVERPRQLTVACAKLDGSRALRLRTKRRTDDDGDQEILRPDRRSNHDEALFGPQVYTFTTAQSVEAGRRRREWWPCGLSHRHVVLAEPLHAPQLSTPCRRCHTVCCAG